MFPFFDFDEGFFTTEDLLLLAGASGSLTEATATGNPATFTTDVQKPLVSLIAPFTPIQAGSGDPSPSNVRAISGFTGITAYRTGKNMANLVGYSASSTNNLNPASFMRTNGYGTEISTIDPDRSITVTQSDSTTDYAKANYRNGYVVIQVADLVFGQKYDISMKISNITSNPLDSALTDLTMASPGSGNSTGQVSGDTVIFKNINYIPYDSQPGRRGFEMRICGMSFTLSDVLITPANENDGVYEPYTGNSFPVTFPDGQTIYGGTLDLVSGVLTVDRAAYTSDGTDYDNWAVSNTSETINRFSLAKGRLPHNPKNSSTGNLLCNWLKSQSSGVNAWNAFIGSTGNFLCYVPADVIADKEAWGTYTTDHPLTFVYELDEPYTVQLDPVTIQTLIGNNTVWTDTNGTNTVVYLKKA